MDDPVAVVVMYVTLHFALKILEATEKEGLSGHFVWVGTDGWGSRYIPKASLQILAHFTLQCLSGLQSLSKAAVGAIASHPVYREIPNFRDYFFALDPASNSRNPWFRHAWESLHGCKVARHRLRLTSASSRVIADRSGPEKQLQLRAEQRLPSEAGWDGVWLHALCMAAQLSLRCGCEWVRSAGGGCSESVRGGLGSDALAILRRDSRCLSRAEAGTSRRRTTRQPQQSHIHSQTGLLPKSGFRDRCS